MRIQNSQRKLCMSEICHTRLTRPCRELFAKEGEVFAVRLMKDKRTGKRRGFGFVVMASSDVDSAIAALNEKDYMQRTLKVRVANDSKHPDGEMFEQD